MNRFIKLLLAIGLVGLGACGNDGGDQVAQVRFLQASPDSPSMDVTLNGAALENGLTYGNVTDYTIVSSGSPQLDFNAAGTNNLIVSENPKFDNDSAHTVIVTGFAGSVNAVTYPDDNSLAEPGNAKLRTIHASPSTGDIDVYVTAPGVDINTVTPTVDGLQFVQDSAYFQTAAGTYQVRMTAAGSKTPLADTTVVLGTGQVRTAVLLDAAGGGDPLQVQFLTGVE